MKVSGFPTLKSLSSLLGDFFNHFWPGFDQVFGQFFDQKMKCRVPLGQKTQCRAPPGQRNTVLQYYLLFTV